ncbi:hypothetical protein M1P56_28230 [Streptomyces sp. HU2014]|uniref:Uncharacterized protein n=1 Tax=Streptomyces albireticuli TaxID=1940 RepID=A0A1Z2L0Z9_9ACTN|nr:MULTISPECIES: hypothetical protein [Streptomyces]ARZ67936.1 hypothetical protein SMD11_2285 [Streptomyces albireticuli]UQI47947.1 hypothetical protein M1P56_28230 [Streptomyces sp. HU2014]
MEHELRAEYADGFSPEDADAVVKTWHVVRQEGTTGMCGRELSPGAATRSADDWGKGGVPICHSCGALFLRESP